MSGEQFTNGAQEATNTFFNALEREKMVRNKTRGSATRFHRARRSLAGGVSSGLRRSARPYPLYFDSGHGSRITDVDGNTYIDYSLAWGPLILGHSPPEITKAVSIQLNKGMTFGAQHDLEIEAAELMKKTVPCAELVCFSNSGTEIVQVALRLARAATGRRKLVKFEGHYHGWADSVLVSYHPTQEDIAAGEGGPIPVGAGQSAHDDALIATWNDPASVEDIFARHPNEISAVICEPMLCNSGCIPPEQGFLEFLRRITQTTGALLIFDEVITGFRLSLAGAQGFYGVTPDLATYAKALGSGVAVSALAGMEKYMGMIANDKVVHGGTLNGNGIAMAATKATIEALILKGSEGYHELQVRGNRLRRGLEKILSDHGHQVMTSGCGSIFQLSFSEKAARNYRETLVADKRRYSDLAVALLDEGVLVLPDGRWYLSFAHSDNDVDATLEAIRRAVG